MLLRILCFVERCKLNNTDECTLKVKNASVKCVLRHGADHLQSLYNLIRP
jgi:hypothetical protein